MKKKRSMRCWWRASAPAALAALLLSATPALAAPKTVFMVLWRGETRVEEGFRAHLAEKDLDIDLIIRSLDRDTGNVPAVLEEIEETGPDLVYTWGTSTTLNIAGRQPDLMDGPDDYPPQVTDRPIVFTMVSQPVKSRIIEAFGPTGRNVTGVSHVVPLETQFQAMNAYMPVSRIAVIYTPTEPNSVANVEQLQELGERLGINVDTFPVPLDGDGMPQASSLPGLVADAAALGPQFLYLGPDSFIGEYAKTITDAANQLKLPTFASTERSLTSSDALYGLVAPYPAVGRLTAQKVEAILFEGLEPGEIPVETLPQFSYQIRLDIARQLGVTPALSLMNYAEFIGE